MKALTIFALLISSLAYGQNYVMNGSSWYDEDYDNVGDGWYIGPGTNPQIDSGRQYGASGGQVLIGQQLYIGNPLNKHYRLSFDLWCGTWTQVRIMVTPITGYIVSAPNPQPPIEGHVEIEFTYTQPTIYAIEFLTVYGGVMGIDNVELVEIFPVSTDIGIPISDSGPVEWYDLTGRKLREAPKGYYIERRGGVGKIKVK